jgi:ATP synthase protein I
MTGPNDELSRKLEAQVRRRKRAESQSSTLLAQTTYLGTLGLLFILPVLGGAYLGLWLDSRAEGYSIAWTLGLMIAGLCFGAFGVYRFVRSDHG